MPRAFFNKSTKINSSESNLISSESNLNCGDYILKKSFNSKFKFDSSNCIVTNFNNNNNYLSVLKNYNNYCFNKNYSNSFNGSIYQGKYLLKNNENIDVCNKNNFFRKNYDICFTLVNGVRYPNLRNNWTAITCNNSGIKLVAGTNDKLYMSSNSGISWILSYNSFMIINSIASSSDGTLIIIGPYGGGILESRNSGNSWQIVSSLNIYTFNSITILENNEYIGAVGNSGIYSSFTNSTIQLVSNSETLSVLSVASSSDSINQFATCQNQQEGSSYNGRSYIFKSTDSGATWTQVLTTISTVFSSIVCSSTGSICIVGTQSTPPNCGIYISIDTGNNWNFKDNTSNYNINSLSCSTNGNIIAIATDNGLYKSINTGNTWTLIPNTNDTFWSGIVMQETGNIIFAINADYDIVYKFVS